MAKNPLTYADALTNALALEGMNEDTRVTLLALKASIEKKNASDRKPTATQTANENTKAEILTVTLLPPRPFLPFLPLDFLDERPYPFFEEVRFEDV